MPKSKRDKKISLTKTDKKGLALKQRIVEDVRNCIAKFNSVYVFSYKDMRTIKMQDIRQEWKPSRFFFGKNKVIAIGLGRNAEEEVQDGLHNVTKHLKGQCALLFTDCTRDEVVEWFDNFKYEDFARSSFVTKESITLKDGPQKQFSHAIEPYLRQLGLPTKLEKGVVTLIKDYDVCKKGQALTPEQAKILELFEYRLATFKFTLKACWSKENGYEKLISKDDDDEETEGIEEEAEDGVEMDDEDVDE